MRDIDTKYWNDSSLRFINTDQLMIWISLYQQPMKAFYAINRIVTITDKINLVERKGWNVCFRIFFVKLGYFSYRIGIAWWSIRCDRIPFMLPTNEYLDFLFSFNVVNYFALCTVNEFFYICKWHCTNLVRILLLEVVGSADVSKDVSSIKYGLFINMHFGIVTIHLLFKRCMFSMIQLFKHCMGIRYTN